MRSGLFLVNLVLVAVALGQDDAAPAQVLKKEKVFQGQAFIRGVLAAETKAFGRKRIESRDAVRNRSFSSLKNTGTHGSCDKEYAKFVTQVDQAQLLGKTYRMLIHVDKVSPGSSEGVFRVVSTWTPMKRDWRHYMTPSQKRDYGKSTGRKRSGLFVQNVYTSSDRARDEGIEHMCRQRKEEIEEIHVRMELSAEHPTDIRLVEIAEIVGTIRDFSITHHENFGHAVSVIVMDVSDIKVKKHHK